MSPAVPPGDGPSDAHVEQLLRQALRARADAVQIDGDGLRLIRERSTRRRRPAWATPILAGAAAAAVIVGIAVVPRIMAIPANDSAAAAGSGSVLTTTSGASAPNTSPPAQSPATDPSGQTSETAAGSFSQNGAASAGSATATVVPMPVSEDTPLVYPYPTTKALASAARAGTTTLDLTDPEAVAAQFAQATGDNTDTYTTEPAVLSSETVPGSSGVIVTVSNADGLAISNVYLRPVIVDDATVWGVVGASRDGGDLADLTVDPPKQADGNWVLSGRFVSPIAGGPTLTVSYGGVAPSVATQAFTDVTATEDRWSVTTPASAVPTGNCVVVTVQVKGRIIALVATTISQ